MLLQIGQNELTIHGFREHDMDVPQENADFE